MPIIAPRGFIFCRRTCFLLQVNVNLGLLSTCNMYEKALYVIFGFLCLSCLSNHFGGQVQPEKCWWNLEVVYFCSVQLILVKNLHSCTFLFKINSYLFMCFFFCKKGFKIQGFLSLQFLKSQFCVSLQLGIPEINYEIRIIRGLS